MPYTKEELNNLEFYQNLSRRDEQEYLGKISKTTDEGDTVGGILRDKGGNIILFEKIIPGQGTDGTSHPENHSISYEDGYRLYEENEELNKIIKREFTEF